MSTSAKNLNGFGTIPGDWDVATLREVVFYQEGPGLRKWQWTESGMKVINVTNILGDGQIDTSNTSRHISIEEYEKTYRHFTVNAGDIVVASSGNTYGKVGRITAKDLPLMMNTSVIRFRSSDSERLDDDFLYAFLRSDVFRNQVESFVIGSAQPNFGPTHLKRMVMPLPRLRVQRRIAAILTAYDELIENSQRRIRILEAMARALYREWFVHFRFPGHENHPRVATPLGGIPKGWEVRKVAEFADFVRGFEPGSDAYHKEPGEDRIKFLRVGDLSKRDSDLYIHERLAEGVVLAPFDIAITLDGSVGQVRLGLQGAYSSGIRRVDVKDSSRLGWSFAYQILLSDATQATIQAHAKGTTIKHAGTAVAALDFVSPPSALIEKFEGATAPMLMQVLSLQDQIENLRRTRDLLLPRLLSGQIEVEAA